MDKPIADALLDFYQKILKPELDFIKEKLVEHDQRFSEMLGHFDAIYRRLERLEDELLMVNNRLNRIEEAVNAGSAKHSDLEKRVKDLKAQIDLLQTRLEIVERHLETSS